MDRKKALITLSLALAIALFIIPMALSQESAYGDAIVRDNYEISRSKVERTLEQGVIFKENIEIINKRNSELTFSISSSPEISDIIEFDTVGELIKSNNKSVITFNIIAKQVGVYNGQLDITGDITETIPVNITISNESTGQQFFTKVELTKSRFTFNDQLDFKVDVKKIIGSEDIRNVSFNYTIDNIYRNNTHLLGSETKDLLGSIQIRKKFDFPKDLNKGFYVLDVTTDYKNKTYVSSAEFQLSTPFWSIKLFGLIPLWLLAIILGAMTLIVFAIVITRRIIEKNKKYKMQVYTKTLPKKGERTFWLGKVAETNLQAYYDADLFTTHGVVAGATGGGKSISAQVIIEEALQRNIAVIVFDPTAQWSGMLRKCEDKKMMSFYPKFGMKPSDSKAFPGNVRQIQNERQAIDIRKYMNPGQIQIFTMNKLTPPQIDTFVASIIASIFRSDPKEYPELRTMLVFDEVHRLLPKFGGSGKGFLQIERACREFRKWGFGVMLVSQVLSDFVGEIKANINTEVQMRTRDEADLERLKTKYGEEFLQSLIKASVGVGMFVNPKYNRGKPYFINFRPIMHSTRRLSDEVLEQYNKYGESIDDIEFQIEQLEKEKVDTFDLKMELKLVKDKLMTGNFTVVDIYLEGLKPRITKQWETLGKKPKKRELELVDTSEIEASLKQAQKGREEFEKEKKDAPKESPPAGGDREEKKEEKTEEKTNEEGKEKTEKEETLKSDKKEDKKEEPKEKKEDKK